MKKTKPRGAYRNRPRIGKPTADIHIIGTLNYTDLVVNFKRNAALHVNTEHNNYDTTNSIVIEGDIYVSKGRINNTVVTSKLATI